MDRMARLLALVAFAGAVLTLFVCRETPVLAPIHPTVGALPATSTSVAASAEGKPLMANELDWETAGGGQITLRITLDGTDYDVAVSSFEFKDREDIFTITSDSGEVYRALSDVMRDQSRIQTDESGAPGGSWTTLRFRNDGHSSTYENVIVEGDLRMICDYIVAQIGGAS